MSPDRTKGRVRSQSLSVESSTPLRTPRARTQSESKSVCFLDPSTYTQVHIYTQDPNLPLVEKKERRKVRQKFDGSGVFLKKKLREERRRIRSISESSQTSDGSHSSHCSATSVSSSLGSLSMLPAAGFAGEFAGAEAVHVAFTPPMSPSPASPLATAAADGGADADVDVVSAPEGTLRSILRKGSGGGSSTTAAAAASATVLGPDDNAPHYEPPPPPPAAGAAADRKGAPSFTIARGDSATILLSHPMLFSALTALSAVTTFYLMA